MQLDMHYYGTYAIARIAGFPPDMARTVATAAEYVDEALSATPINLGGQGYMLPVISSHEPSELAKNFDQMDQWNVWVPFHFLPGGIGNTVDERLICLWSEEGNLAAEAVIRLALRAGGEKKDYALHLLGLVTHVIQDTYAHYGFSGMSSDNNAVDQSSLTLIDAKNMDEYIKKKQVGFWEKVLGAFAEATRLGHAGVATLPDRPYLLWEFDYEKPLDMGVDYLNDPHDNPKTFFMACTRLHAVYTAFLKGSLDLPGEKGHLPFADSVAAAIQEVIEEGGDKEARCTFWRTAIGQGTLFSPADEDVDLLYDNRGWEVGAMQGKAIPSTTEAFSYNQAARVYLNEIHGNVLPGLRILS